jgi:hypothetical protein
MFSKLTITQRILIFAAIALIFYFIFKAIQRAITASRIRQAISDSRVTVDLPTAGTGGTASGSSPVTVNLGAVANEIYDAFYRNDWFGYSEDEDRAISALQSIPKELTPLLANEYAKHGKNLYEDFTKFLSSSDYAKVKDWLRK